MFSLDVGNHMLDDDAVAKVGAPPMLRDTASRPQSNGGAGAGAGAGDSPRKNGAAGNTTSKPSPELNKDSLTQLRQLDASTARVDASTRKIAQMGSGRAADSASSSAKKADAAQSSASDKKKSNSNSKQQEHFDDGVGQEYVDAQRELQEEEEDIQALAEAQRSAAQAGRFLEAHRLQRQVKEAAREHQLHVEKDMHYGKMQALLSSREVTHSHRDKLMIFTSEWEKQLSELERRAAEERNELAGRHQRELAEQEEIIRAQIAARTVNQKSKALTEAQQTTQRLASQQFYFEAHQAQRFQESLEQKERDEKEKRMQRELARRMSALRVAKAKEMSALEARIESAREAMLTQRARDYETLILKQYNKQVSEEQKVRVEFGQRRAGMARKMVGLQTRMARRTQMAQTKSGRNADDEEGSKPNTASTTNGGGQPQQQQQHLYRYGQSNTTPRRQQQRSVSGSGGGSTAKKSATGGGGGASASAHGRHILVPMGIDYGRGGADELPLPVAVHPAQSSVVIVKSSIPGAAAVYGGGAGAAGVVSPNAKQKRLSPSPPSGAPPPAPPPRRPGSGSGVNVAKQ